MVIMFIVLLLWQRGWKIFVLVYGSTVCKDTFFSETLVVLYVKNNKILIFLIEYERDKDMFNVRLYR